MPKRHTARTGETAYPTARGNVMKLVSPSLCPVRPHTGVMAGERLWVVCRVGLGGDGLINLDTWCIGQGGSADNSRACEVSNLCGLYLALTGYRFGGGM